MKKALTTCVALALISALLGACSAAPGAEGEMTAEATGAMKNCSGDNICPDPPTPNPAHCAYDPLANPTRTPTPGEQGYSEIDTGFTANDSCTNQGDGDELSTIERTLLTQYHCSLPVFWWAERGGGLGDAVMLLCSNASGADAYVNSIGHLVGTDRHEGATRLPHVNTTYTDNYIPPPPNGYYWVVPWECPVCPPNGCMLQVDFP